MMIEEQTRPAQFGVAIEAEDQDLLVGRRHSAQALLSNLPHPYGFVGQVHHPLYIESQEIDLPLGRSGSSVLSI